MDTVGWAVVRAEAEEGEDDGNVIDLMEALKKSVDERLKSGSGQKSSSKSSGSKGRAS